MSGKWLAIVTGLGVAALAVAGGYMKSSGLKSNDWEVIRKPNALTKREDIEIGSIQKSTDGVYAHLRGYCNRDYAIISAVVVDSDGNATIKLPMSDGIVEGKARIDDQAPRRARFTQATYRNELTILTLIPDGTAKKLQEPINMLGSLENTSAIALGVMIVKADAVKTYFAEIPTADGSIVVNVPVSDARVQTLVRSCDPIVGKPGT
jgi:hypothetical protein